MNGVERARGKVPRGPAGRPGWSWRKNLIFGRSLWKVLFCFLRRARRRRSKGGQGEEQAGYCGSPGEKPWWLMPGSDGDSRKQSDSRCMKKVGQQIKAEGGRRKKRVRAYSKVWVLRIWKAGVGRLGENQASGEGWPMLRAQCLMGIPGTAGRKTGLESRAEAGLER